MLYFRKYYIQKKVIFYAFDGIFVMHNGFLKVIELEEMSNFFESKISFNLGEDKNNFIED